MRILYIYKYINFTFKKDTYYTIQWKTNFLDENLYVFILFVSENPYRCYYNVFVFFSGKYFSQTLRVSYLLHQSPVLPKKKNNNVFLVSIPSFKKKTNKLHV